MKDDLYYFLGADLLTVWFWNFLQITPVGEFVVTESLKVFAAIFIGFIGGFMGVIGKRVGEDYIRQRRQNKQNKNNKDVGKDQ